MGSPMAEFIFDFLLSCLGDFFAAFLTPMGNDQKHDIDRHDRSTPTSEW
jgi:hypothetical protein